VLNVWWLLEWEREEEKLRGNEFIQEHGGSKWPGWVVMMPHGCELCNAACGEGGLEGGVGDIGGWVVEVSGGSRFGNGKRNGDMALAGDGVAGEPHDE
jgi:hypothetical protein